MIRSICDIADDHRDLVQAADPVFKDYAGLKSFHGPITTLRCHEDNLLLRQVQSTAGEGRVMIEDGGGSLRPALLTGSKLLKGSKVTPRQPRLPTPPMQMMLPPSV